MTMWGVTQTQRFHAAVAGAGIAHWISYYGQNGIDEWMIRSSGPRPMTIRRSTIRRIPDQFHQERQDPDLHLRRRTRRRGAAASRWEFWHALHAEGVPTSLVIYPGEGHGVRRPDHVQDLNRRILAWFDKYLGAGLEEAALIPPRWGGGPRSGGGAAAAPMRAARAPQSLRDTPRKGSSESSPLSPRPALGPRTGFALHKGGPMAHQTIIGARTWVFEDLKTCWPRPRRCAPATSWPGWRPRSARNGRRALRPGRPAAEELPERGPGSLRRRRSHPADRRQP